jgi:hypothetical protein
MLCRTMGELYRIPLFRDQRERVSIKDAKIKVIWEMKKHSISIGFHSFVDVIIWTRQVHLESLSVIWMDNKTDINLWIKPCG